MLETLANRLFLRRSYMRLNSISIIFLSILQTVESLVLSYSGGVPESTVSVVLIKGTIVTRVLSWVIICFYMFFTAICRVFFLRIEVNNSKLLFFLVEFFLTT